MAKSLVLGNGTLLLCIDQFGQVKDFYYPYVGSENHVGRGAEHKIGVYVDNSFSWINDGSWNIDIAYESGTMVSHISAENKKLGISLFFTDVIYNESNIFVRKVDVKNKSARRRTIKLFFNQQFNISETNYGNTAYLHQSKKAIVYYKNHRVFVTSLYSGGSHFNAYSIGLLGIEGKEGTWKDAEDGNLEENGIEHGSVDSVLEMDCSLPPRGSTVLYHWVTAGKTMDEAWALNLDIEKRTPAHLIESTRNYWKAWLTKRNFVFQGLDRETIDLFHTSLLVIRAHIDNHGGIIASGDSDILQYGRDTYSYVWPRDGAFTALALEKAGYFHVAERFFTFCQDILTNDGYLLHKYNSDKSVGASWHPWVTKNGSQLPIQEDETALVLNMLWEHYDLTRDLEFVEGMYNPFIKRSADFLVAYRDKKNHLPLPSYDLWEERRGVHCFTASVVYSALIAAARFAKALGKDADTARYHTAATEVRNGILQHFYDRNAGYFVRTLWFKDNDVVKDMTIDASSAYGIFKFGVLPADDRRVISAFEQTRERLGNPHAVGGLARYEGDYYRKADANVPGNPWFITTLWYVEYLIARARSDADLDPVRKWLSWATKYAHGAGMLSEQLHPRDGSPISVSPLTWSHTRFVLIVIIYLEKLNELGICKNCYPIKSNI